MSVSRARREGGKGTSVKQRHRRERKSDDAWLLATQHEGDEPYLLRNLFGGTL